MKLSIILFLICSSIFARVYNFCSPGDFHCLTSQSDFRKQGIHLPILQGHTTQNSTEINVLVPKRFHRKLRYVVNKNNKKLKVSIKTYFKRYSEWGIAKIFVKKLSPSSDYELNIYYKNNLIDSRIFSTLEQPSNASVTFAVASCLNDSKQQKQIAMWNKVDTHRPEFIFLIGDNVYADYPTKTGEIIHDKEEHIWTRYVETRLSLGLFRMKTLIPTYAIWDDHDFGQNNSGRRNPIKKQAKEIFKYFYAQEKTSRGPGISFSTIIKDINFIFLDNRYFRGSNNNSNAPHIGEEQLTWLKNLRHNLPSFIIQGDQFFGAYHDKESFEGLHPEEFSRFIEIIKSKRTPFVFLSGDRHVYELMQIESNVLGHETIEITSSGMHAPTRKGVHKQYPNPRRVEGIDDDNLFVIVEALNDNNNLKIKLSVESEEKTVSKKEFTIGVKNELPIM